jgi:hypothetical protein
MKHDTQELLFAAEVRKLAAAIRGASVPDELEGAAVYRWKQENPETDRRFVEAALERISLTADRLKALRTDG